MLDEFHDDKFITPEGGTIIKKFEELTEQEQQQVLLIGEQTKKTTCRGK